MYRLLINYFLTLFLIGSVSYACQSQNTLLKHKLDSIRTYIAEEKAIDTIAQIARAYRNDQDWNSWSTCKKEIVKLLRRQNDLDRILDSLFVWKSINGMPLSDLATWTYLEGYTHTKKGNVLLGVEAYKKAQVLYFELSDSITLFKINRNLGNNYSRINDHQSARLYYNKAMRYSGQHEKLITRKERLRFDILNTYIYQGEFGKALAYWNENFEEKEHNAEATLKKILILINTEKLKEAEEIFNTISNNPQISYEYYTVYGELLQAKGNYKAALDVRKKIVDIWDGGFTRDLMAEMVRLSKLYLENREFSEASTILDSVILYFAPGFNTIDNFSVNERSINYSIWLVEALQSKGDIFIKDMKSSNINQAILYYQAAFDVLLKLKEAFISDLSKYDYGLLSKEIAEKLMRLKFKEYEVSRNAATFNAAFKLCQDANAFVLKNAVELRSILNDARVDDQLKNKFLALEHKVSQTTDTIQVEVLQEYEQVKKQLYDQFNIFEGYYTENTVALRDIQENISENSIFIKYFLGKKQFYVFSISKDQYQLQAFDLPNEYEDWVEQMWNLPNQAFTSDLEQEFLKASHELYRSFVDPLWEMLIQYSHIIIVPDERLREISFAVLSKKPTKSWSDINEFLISDFSFSYLHYSAQLNRNINEHKRKPQMIGISLSYDQNYMNRINEHLSRNEELKNEYSELRLEELKFVENEVEEIVSSLDGKTFRNNEVRDDMIKNHLQEQDIVHLTGHTWVDENDYLNSSLLIYPDSTNDIFLSNADILQLNLSNELVVLSTCESSYGHNVRGEGILSLGRSLSYSGVRSVLGNYWKVPDQSSSSIMKLYYGNLVEGQTKDEALRNAQLSYLKSDDLSNPMNRTPVDWGGWVLFGDNQPIMQERNSLDDFFIAIFCFVSFIIIMFILKRFVWNSIESK